MLDTSWWVLFVFLILLSFHCRSTKKLQTAVNTKDTVIIRTAALPASLKPSELVLKNLKESSITFKTFSAKIKVEYEDANGKKPDVTANIVMQKDSAILISIIGSFLFITGEAFRVLITADHITIINRLDKVVEERPFSFIQEFAKIPLDLRTLQDLIIGNPLYIGDSIVAYRETANSIVLSTIGKVFKNLVTLQSTTKLLERNKLDDLDLTQNRTGDFSYGDYENKQGQYFATYREITVAEKTKVDVRLTFKQYEFNGPVTFAFSRPKNYKIK